MAAAYGAVLLRGVSGRTYYKDIYLSDTANAFITFDSGSGASATSDNKTVPQENVFIEDVVVVTGTAKTKIQIVVNGAPTGDILRQTVHLSSVTFRPRLAIPVSKGAQLQMIELT